jgi:quercetin dioxygenase-like cupin family protein
MPGNLIDWQSLEEKTIIPGFHGKVAHSANMTFVLWRIDAGAVLPEHAHLHEQVVQVFEGEMELTIDGEVNKTFAGSMAVIPSRARHSAKALTACRVMDVFYPIREDYRPGGKPLIAIAAEQS